MLIHFYYGCNQPIVIIFPDIVVRGPRTSWLVFDFNSKTFSGRDEAFDEWQLVLPDYHVRKVHECE